MALLKRKIDKFLQDWKLNKERKPLIIKGARQIGKTTSILDFAKNNYENVVYINFISDLRYQGCFQKGFDVETIVKELSFVNPDFQFVKNKTIIILDEIQAYPDASTCLKFFALDKRFDVICIGNITGEYYKKVTSNSAGYKTEYTMHSLDFEEFLWANGYQEWQIKDIFENMINQKPFSKNEFNVLSSLFNDFIFVGGFPRIVKIYIEQKHFSNLLNMQKSVLENNIFQINSQKKNTAIKKTLKVYESISPFLGKENKRFMFSKVEHNARFRDYFSTMEWLKDSGLINISYLLNNVEFPFLANYDSSQFKIYHHDTSLLIASLDKETQDDLRIRKNLNTYKGAIYENIVAESLRKQEYDLFYWKNPKSTIEIDFIVRDMDYIVPLEIKANNKKATSLINFLELFKNKNVKYGIKFANSNIGFKNNIYTFPYFCIFMLRNFLKDLALKRK